MTGRLTNGLVEPHQAQVRLKPVGSRLHQSRRRERPEGSLSRPRQVLSAAGRVTAGEGAERGRRGATEVPEAARAVDQAGGRHEAYLWRPEWDRTGVTSLDPHTRQEGRDWDG